MASGEISRLRRFIFELVLFPMLGALMFASKILLEVLPNIHLLGMFTVLFTLIFRQKALIPLYIYVFLNGLYAGFAMWWIPYLYIWTLLWGVTMLLPKNMPRALCFVVYPLICGIHGMLFGTLYAPVQALIYHFDFKTTLAWIVAGLPWDAINAAGNMATGFLIVPLYELIQKLLRTTRFYT